MRTFRSGLAAATLFLCSAASVLAQEAKRPITFDDMIQLHRVGNPKISFDGKWVAYVVATPDTSANRNASNLWIVPTSGGMPLQLTQSGHDSSPEWSPDAKTLAFLSSREGTSQVYLLPMDGGEAHAVTHLSTGADLVKWSPDERPLRLRLRSIRTAKMTTATKRVTPKREEQGQGARLRATLVSPLDALVRRQTQPCIRDRGGWQRRAARPEPRSELRRAAG